MTHYKITRKTPKKGYGVTVTKVKTVDNISDNYSIVKLLVDTCNKLQVEFEHFEDVLENFAEDYKTF